MQRVDLLMLNASNYAVQPIFPYAFVQVSALARSRGLSVARCDLLGTDRRDWDQLVASLIEEHRPRMVGFHVRQADSQLIDEYKPVNGLPPEEAPYFPVDDTRALISMVRATTDAPVVVGGFGFTVHARKMLSFLGADYGVVGGPDAFFDAFDALADRDLSEAAGVGNLLFHEGAEVRAGPLRYFGPHSGPEYDDTIFDELCAFYGRHGVSLSRRGARGEAEVAVEVLRGCPCRCYFCTEPTVKGRKLQARSFDAILADVRFLADRGVRVVWFVCSELNMGGMRFALELAGHMRRFNADRGDERVLWRAYSMPKPGMSRGDLEVLMASGYLHGWNEFASFDDANLRDCRMPYRAADVVAFYRTLRELTADPSIYHGEPPSRFELFLGNAFMTPAAMRTTLEVADREGFSQDQFYGDSANATRVYEIGGTLSCGTPADLRTIGPEGPSSDVDILRPTFHYAPELVAALGDEAAVDAFIHYASSTLLTRNHQTDRDVAGFLMAATTPGILASHLGPVAAGGQRITERLKDERGRSLADGDPLSHLRAADLLGLKIWREPSPATVGLLWRDSPAPPAVRTLAARTLLTVLSLLSGATMDPVYALLGLQDPEDRRTPYRIMRSLYARFDSNDGVVDGVTRQLDVGDSSLEVLLLRYLMYGNDVRIVPAYRPLMFHPAPGDVHPA